MLLQSKINHLQKDLEKFSSFSALQKFLRDHKIDLVVTIFSSGFSCIDWHLIDNCTSGILKFAVKIKVSDLSSGGQTFYTSNYIPIDLEGAESISHKKVLEKITQGIKESIRQIN